MELLDLTPNTDEWLAHRKTTLNASDAAAVMSASPYKTRSQLLDEMAGWKSTEELTPFKKALFAKGHKYEEMARPHVEMDLMLDLPPAVGVRKYRGITRKLGASFDGLCQKPLILWEHKSWNEKLVENVENAQLEPSHYWQLEHQMLVADATEVIFTVSDGSFDKRRSFTYKSDPARRKELVAAWKQFEKDLKDHVPAAKKSVQTEAPAITLPAITAELNGTQVTTNMASVIDQVRQLASEEMDKELVSDFDFSSKENLTKAVKKARESLKAKVESIESGFESFAEFKAYAVELDGILQKMQSDGERKVKAEKEARKQAIIDDARQSVIDHLIEISKPFNGLDDAEIFNLEDYTPDFKAVIKGKKTLESIESACKDLAAKAKANLSETAEHAAINYEWFIVNAKDNEFLFGDLESKLSESHEGFKALCKQRIADYKDNQERLMKAATKATEDLLEEMNETAKVVDIGKAKADDHLVETFHDSVVEEGTPHIKDDGHRYIPIDEVWIEQKNPESPATLMFRFEAQTFQTKFDMNDGVTTVVSKLDQLAREIQARVK